ncbi:MAG: CRISPR-associated endonuclease Cas2 [Saprospiraceae bacterium]|nr:CRISPR-associated endonuclease Cas2 [Saprospiraceae bacterium]MCB0544815.1 CRISPR-associated endonuclease Cas2 [Saprospiraceae bacterium]MCB0573033.1 CRISPR-associated endonuclease Cas2 [Saprospiraceae bacterium]MCB9356538.1 CRISPR-associated endonuclease Cas2 [Lewinellaceae bacterium]
MYYWVSYDISHHRTRRMAAKWCKQAGLLRLQRSVFAGRSDAGHIQELVRQFTDVLAPDDRYCIVPIDKTAWKNMLLLGNQPDKRSLGRRAPVRYF